MKYRQYLERIERADDVESVRELLHSACRDEDVSALQFGVVVDTGLEQMTKLKAGPQT